MTTQTITFQEIIMKLQQFWSDQGCVILQPYDTEKGAGTMSPHTFLNAIGPKPVSVAYVEPSRRPTDGRYAKNPNRLQHYFQFQVLIKPSPLDIQEMYLDSLKTLGLKTDEHDIRFVEDNWESPTLGAWGLGWEVWLNGQEITQFTYFQQCGGLPCKPVSVEITYGIERIATLIQEKDSVFDIIWQEQAGKQVTYRDIYEQNEIQQCKYNFELANIKDLFSRFEQYEKECLQVIAKEQVYPAYDYCLKCSHTFNLLDARSALSVSERQKMIQRIRKLANQCAIKYEEMING